MVNKIPLCLSSVCITSPTGEHLNWYHILTIVSNVTVNTKVRSVFSRLISFLLSVYPEVKLLGHMIVLFFNFWRTSILFSIMIVLIHIPISNTQRLSFLHIPVNICLSCLFSSSHLNSNILTSCSPSCELSLHLIEVIFTRHGFPLPWLVVMVSVFPSTVPVGHLCLTLINVFSGALSSFKLGYFVFSLLSSVSYRF